jgi:hypothetical protein
MSVYDQHAENGVIAVKAWNDENGKPVTRVALKGKGVWGMILEPHDRDELIRMLTEAKEHTG